LKTVFIVTSGVVFFGDTITLKKFIGVACAMGGIVWYTSTGIVAPPPSSSSNGNGSGDSKA
jgi:drug/metabolite transporter (DMT)-like permease